MRLFAGVWFDNYVVDDTDVKEETIEEDSYFEADGDMMDTEFLEEESANGADNKTPDYAIANVSCQYDGSPGKYPYSDAS